MSCQALFVEAPLRACRLGSRAVATFALIHGGGGSAWDWHLVVPELNEHGHESIAVDLPTEAGSAGWWAYADAVVDAVPERQPVVVVGHSLGGFTAPLACARISVDLLVLVPR
jgi:pimeloyl-ACP methyl ester carboxylesterase